MRVFLAFAFREDDRSLVADIEELLGSHDVQVITGERLGGGPVTAEVETRIASADGLIALLTRREPTDGGGWATHKWVEDEYELACRMAKRTIALIEEHVVAGKAAAQREFIRLDRGSPHRALLALTSTVGLWKREFGRQLRVRVSPDTVGRLMFRDGAMKCQYRFVTAGRYSEWIEATPIPEPGGTFIYVDGIGDGQLIQLQVEGAQQRWRSLVTSPCVQIRLAREERRA